MCDIFFFFSFFNKDYITLYLSIFFTYVHNTKYTLILCFPSILFSVRHNIYCLHLTFGANRLHSIPAWHSKLTFSVYFDRFRNLFGAILVSPISETFTTVTKIGKKEREKEGKVQVYENLCICI